MLSWSILGSFLYLYYPNFRPIVNKKGHSLRYNYNVYFIILNKLIKILIFTYISVNALILGVNLSRDLYWKRENNKLDNNTVRIHYTSTGESVSEARDNALNLIDVNTFTIVSGNEFSFQSCGTKIYVCDLVVDCKSSTINFKEGRSD